MVVVVVMVGGGGRWESDACVSLVRGVGCEGTESECTGSVVWRMGREGPHPGDRMFHIPWASGQGGNEGMTIR